MNVDLENVSVFRVIKQRNGGKLLCNNNGINLNVCTSRHFGVTPKATIKAAETNKVKFMCFYHTYVLEYFQGETLRF